jgi:hypothetical protein
MLVSYKAWKWFYAKSRRNKMTLSPKEVAIISHIWNDLVPSVVFWLAIAGLMLDW